MTKKTKVTKMRNQLKTNYI